MGLTVEILGLVMFLGVHAFATMRGRRAALVQRIGEWPYKGLFSLVSIVGLVLVGYGFAWYRDGGLIVVWIPPSWMHEIVEGLMWPACILLAAAYIPGFIKRALKHPMLAGVKTWAAAHLCANGDLGGMILFGSVLLWAGYDRAILKYRTDPGAPPIPVGGIKNDIGAVVVGTLIYLALGFVFHPVVIGMPAFAPVLGN
ncbi:MAG: NnrU family protein [Xanthobacteraceae bacterium]